MNKARLIAAVRAGLRKAARRRAWLKSASASASPRIIIYGLLVEKGEPDRSSRK